MIQRLTFVCFVCRRRFTAPRYHPVEVYAPDYDAACWECSDTEPHEAQEDGREYARKLARPENAGDVAGEP